MLRRLALALAVIMPLPVLAQEAEGFRFAGITLETGGFPGDERYTMLTGTAHALYGLGWADLGVDLTLSTAAAGETDLSAAGALFHLTSHPFGNGVALGPYLWLGTQSEGGAAYAMGLEAAVHTASGWGGEIYLGETRGGILGDDGYATNKGLRMSYTHEQRTSGYFEFAKDTLNLSAGDQDIYRVDIGLDTWVDLPASGTPVMLSVALGQHHFDRLDERQNWVSLGLSIPLGGGGAGHPEFTSRRGVTHHLPLP